MTDTVLPLAEIYLFIQYVIVFIVLFVDSGEEDPEDKAFSTRRQLYMNLIPFFHLAVLLWSLLIVFVDMFKGVIKLPPR